MPPTLYAGVKIQLKKAELLSAALQATQLSDFIEELNQAFKSSLVNPFRLRSTEITGFLQIQDAWRFTELIQYVDLELYTACPRYALGIGTLAKNLDYETVDVDGPLLRIVNRALKAASAGERDVAVRLPSPFLTKMVNTLFYIESNLRNNWSEAHREAIKLAKKGLTQVEIAASLGVTQAAISQRLKHARWELYQEITGTLQELLTQVRWKTLLPWDINKKRRRNRQQGQESN
ncbi:MAG TPA: SatD family protein [Bacillota bacterium]